MRFYNTLTRQTEEFKPITENKVSIYNCGLTVYSQPHIGNWVAYIYWDILERVFKLNGYEVNRVQNITDVGHLTSDADAGEDKMLKTAMKEGLSAWQVADKYIEIADNEAYNQLGLLKPLKLVRATDYITEQIEFVKDLETKGYTYTIKDGVYFDTSKLKDYGKLAKLDLSGLQFGARVADTGKKNPTDFALWKFSPDLSAGGKKRDMEWDSPWGIGFPGWHLECSAIIHKLLGDTIDIHTGGIDHIPVHHTNEIAQSETLTGKPLANTWLHCNHLKVNNTKISKSLGNGYTLRDITDKGYSIDAFKLMILSKHYSTEGNFTWENLDSAQNRLREFEAWADLIYQDSNLEVSDSVKFKQNFLNALNDNLDVPRALIFLNEILQSKPTAGILSFIDDATGFNLSKRKDITREQKDMIINRKLARDQSNWQESDRLRDLLKSEGLEIKDYEYGPIWSRI